jgi:hypothetical protein
LRFIGSAAFILTAVVAALRKFELGHVSRGRRDHDAVLECVQMRSVRIAMSGAVLVAAMASASAQTARTDPHAYPLPVVPSAVAGAEQVRPATVPTPASQSSVLVAVREPLTERLQGARIWRLLLGALGGGALGAAIVWFLMRLATGRDRLTPRRKEGAGQAIRSHWAPADDNRGDDRASAHDRRPDDSGDWQKANPAWRHNQASGSDARRAGSRGSDETGARWRDDQASGSDARRGGPRESDETSRRWSQDQDFGYNSRSDSRERLKGVQPRGYKAAASAYDDLWDALRDGEETGRSLSDIVRDARPRSAPPVQPNPPDELGTTPLRPAETRQSNAGKKLYDSLEQQITSLLGRPIGKNSQRQKADQPSDDAAASAHDSVHDALTGEAANQPRSHDAVSARDAVRDAWPRSTPPIERNLLELDTSPPSAVESRRRNAGRALYDSLEDQITSLLGRSAGKNSRREKADQPSGRNAASAYDAVRDALGGREEADQPIGRSAASAHDIVFDALGETEETTHQPSGRIAASAYDAVRDALSEGEEMDPPTGRDTASVHDAVRDALGEADEIDQPSGRNVASAYDAVRGAQSGGEEVDQPSGHSRASADEALSAAVREWKRSDPSRRYKRF